MKLYELKRGTIFRVISHGMSPPDAPRVVEYMRYKLNTLDGLYSHCTGQDGRTYHISAGAEVEELK